MVAHTQHEVILCDFCIPNFLRERVRSVVDIDIEPGFRQDFANLSGVLFLLLRSL